MFKFRNVISIVSVIVIVTLVGGCSMWGNKDKPSWTVDEGIAYLNTRYGVEFEFLGGSGSGLFGGPPQGFWARTPTIADTHVRFSVDTTGVTEGKTTFTDEYLYYKFMDEAQRAGQPVVGTIFPDYFFMTNIKSNGNYPDTFDGLTSRQEFFDWLKDQALQDDKYSNGQPLVTLTVLAVDQGDSLDAIEAKIVPLLSQSTGWGLEGDFHVPCQLVIKTFSADVFEFWSDRILSKPTIGKTAFDGTGVPGGSEFNPLHEVFVTF